MFMTLKRAWEALDTSKNPPTKTTIPPGRYEIEKILAPVTGVPFLVLKGTGVGASESSWRQWKNGKILNNPKHPNHGKPIDWGEYEVLIEE